MSKLTHFAIAVALLLLLLLWCVFGVFIFVGYGAFGFGADVYVVLWAAIFVACIWGIFSTFRRALRTPRGESPTEKVAEPGTPEQQHDLATPDEKLAHLVKTPGDKNVV